MLPPPWKSKIFRLNSFQELNPVSFDIHKRWVSQLIIIILNPFLIWNRHVTNCLLSNRNYIYCIHAEMPLFGASCIHLFVCFFPLGTRPLELSASNSHVGLQGLRLCPLPFRSPIPSPQCSARLWPCWPSFSSLNKPTSFCWGPSRSHFLCLEYTSPTFLCSAGISHRSQLICHLCRGACTDEMM